MERIKELLNRSIALNGTRQVLACLSSILTRESSFSEEATLIEARQNTLEENIRKGTISAEDSRLEQAQINAAVLGLISSLEQGDLKADAGTSLSGLLDMIAMVEKEKKGNELSIGKTNGVAAIIGMGLLTFMGGLFLSSTFLGTIEPKGMHGEKIDSIALVNMEETILACKDSLVFVHQMNTRLKDSIKAYKADILSLEETIANTPSPINSNGNQALINSLRNQLASKNEALGRCETNLSTCRSSTPPAPISYMAEVTIHCTQNAWDSKAEVAKIKETLNANRHQVLHSTAGAGIAEEYRVEYKKRNNIARKTAHFVMNKMTIDYCLKGTGTITESKNIHLYVPE